RRVARPRRRRDLPGAPPARDGWARRLPRQPATWCEPGPLGPSLYGRHHLSRRPLNPSRPALSPLAGERESAISLCRSRGRGNRQSPSAARGGEGRGEGRPEIAILPVRWVRHTMRPGDGRAMRSNEAIPREQSAATGVVATDPVSTREEAPPEVAP